VWALGITAIEMAESQPPKWTINPMRVIFMITREPPPQLTDLDRWSLPFHDFVAQSLQKVPPKLLVYLHESLIGRLTEYGSMDTTTWSRPPASDSHHIALAMGGT
jgi:hypothetical protein